MDLNRDVTRLYAAKPLFLGLTPIEGAFCALEGVNVHARGELASQYVGARRTAALFPDWSYWEFKDSMAQTTSEFEARRLCGAWCVHTDAWHQYQVQHLGFVL